ncbi:hypothetical protein [Micromonospora aurantiaca (nom. illeg.)]|uniref:Uncharacterized protein n=1 Tax=Micromonospora aurantiaca (nom. illeg.) TaxID=47850 RepID=A0A6N3JTT1_9ACTN|nr:hypothetical protein [Micromonospora aurantiaca]AXH88812.1 hypothetical protein DVH21_02085 [Micromonospora aurantiaca]KAB1111982.1 hypothetical protein F6X54_16030 [Micromonospora aurantiaca]
MGRRLISQVGPEVPFPLFAGILDPTWPEPPPSELEHAAPMTEPAAKVWVALSEPVAGAPPSLAVTLPDGTAVVLTRGQARTLAFLLRLQLDRSRPICDHGTADQVT